MTKACPELVEGSEDQPVAADDDHGSSDATARYGRAFRALARKAKSSVESPAATLLSSLLRRRSLTLTLLRMSVFEFLGISSASLRSRGVVAVDH